MVEKNILVVGGGAIGGMTAAHLVEAGYKVTLYDTDDAHVKNINENGIIIEKFKGKMEIKIPSTTSLSGMYDVVFLSVKSNHTKEAINTILPHIHKTSLVVSLQNGMNEDIIAEMIGKERTIGAVVGWGCTNVGPGHLKQTSEGKNIIGTLDGTITPGLKDIKTMLETFTTTDITMNIYGHLWIKLLINCNVAPVGVSFGSEVKDLISNNKLIPIMIGLTNEIVTVAQASNVPLEKFENILDVDMLKVNSFTDYKRAVAIMKIAGEKHQSIKSTIWQDIEKGRKTEIDYLNGYIEKKAEEYGISTPINAALIKLVKQIENGEKKPSIDNVDDFYKQVRIPKIWQEYNFNEDPEQAFVLLNLPCNQKHIQAANLTSAHLIGSIVAFSKAFDKLTHSIIGKVFIRKTTWQICNFVVSQYLQEMGKTFSEKVTDSYSIEKKDILACAKVIIFYLNNLHVTYDFDKVSDSIIHIKIDATDDPFTEMATNMKIDSSLNLPLFASFFQGIVNHINKSIQFECNTMKKDKHNTYQIVLKQ